MRRKRHLAVVAKRHEVAGERGSVLFDEGDLYQLLAASFPGKAGGLHVDGDHIANFWLNGTKNSWITIRASLVFFKALCTNREKSVLESSWHFAYVARETPQLKPASLVARQSQFQALVAECLRRV